MSALSTLAKPTDMLITTSLVNSIVFMPKSYSRRGSRLNNRFKRECCYGRVVQPMRFGMGYSAPTCFTTGTLLG